MNHPTSVLEPAQRLTRRSLSVNESTTLAIASRAKQMQAEGIRVVSLSTGEPDFPTPEIAKQAAIEAIQRNFTRYTQPEGMPELRKAVAEKFMRENGLPAEAAHVLISAGGKHSIFNAMMAIAQEDDEVIVPAPYWVSYPEIVKLTGAKPVVIPTKPDDNYKITPDRLRQAITSRTKAIILNTPSNPTGVIYSRAELEALGAVIAEAGIFVISDELYEKILYDDNVHFSIGAIPALRDLAITVNGVSKAYAMTGWRIGYMCGPADVMAASARIQSQVTSNPASISQVAALAALTRTTDEVESMVRAFARRRDLVTGLLDEIPDIRFVRPHGAFYVFIDMSAYYGDTVHDSAELATRLLCDHHVATVPGSAFGDDNAIRISYACSDDDIREGIGRIASGLAAIGGK